MSEILEFVMIVSFGASWPMNVLKSYKIYGCNRKGSHFCKNKKKRNTDCPYKAGI